MPPKADYSNADFAADLRACRDALRGGSRTFFAASRVLPRRIGAPATALYAFCREADDIVDCSVTDSAAAGGGGSLDVLHHRLDLIYADRPGPTPCDRALAEVVRRFALPRTLLDALLEGFAWDGAGRRYETLDELQDYAARVAGTVGAMMAVLMGARTPALVARACDLGTAMQLTNIARDVGEDARAGRLYLPQAWLRRAGIDPAAWLRNPRFTPAIATVVQDLLAAADALYARADSGIAGLPWDCRPGIGAARLLYARIGAEVARNGYDSVSRRAVVPGRRKALLLAQSIATNLIPGQPDAATPLASCRALVAAAALPPRRTPRTSFDDRLAWLFDLFARLDEQQAPSRR